MLMIQVVLSLFCIVCSNMLQAHVRNNPLATTEIWNYKFLTGPNFQSSINHVNSVTLQFRDGMGRLWIELGENWKLAHTKYQKLSNFTFFKKKYFGKLVFIFKKILQWGSNYGNIQNYGLMISRHDPRI